MDASVPVDGCERVHDATPSAQGHACHQSTEDAKKEEPPCASLLPPRHG
jgi:hypothetical protein